MLDAHVAFELARWTGPALQESVQQEVAALFAWWGSVPLAELVTPQRLIASVQQLIEAVEPSDQLLRTVTECLRGAGDTLGQEDAVTLGELLPRPHHERLVELVVALREIRPALVQQVTTSAVYTQLISHVLYQGIKSYLTTQNVLARKIPGASSLLRLGQNAMSSAAPSLEKTIDRQLTAFITANVQDTIKGSTAYLIGVLDDEMVWTVADEIWDTNSETLVAHAARLTAGSSMDDAVDALADMALHLIRTPVLSRMLTRLVGEFFRLHGRAPLAQVLAGLGITQDAVAREAGAAAVPIVAQAHRGGYLEARIRARLEPFYLAYSAQEAPSEAAPAPRTAAPPKATSAPKATKATKATKAPRAVAAPTTTRRRRSPTKPDTA
jgi:hypothetical protein